MTSPFVTTVLAQNTESMVFQNMKAINTVHNKDPNEVIIITWNWAPALKAQTISTSTIVLDDGITNDSDSNTDTVVTLTLSGGSDGSEYDVRNRITTSGGETWESAKLIKVRDSKAYG